MPDALVPNPDALVPNPDAVVPKPDAKPALLYNDPSLPTVKLVTAKEAASLNADFIFDSQSFNKPPPKGELSSFGKLVSEKAMTLLVSGDLNPTQLIEVEVDLVVNIIHEYGKLITKIIYPIIRLILDWGKMNNDLFYKLGEHPSKYVLVEQLFKKKDELPIRWVDKTWLLTKMARAVAYVPKKAFSALAATSRAIYKTPETIRRTFVAAPSATASASKPKPLPFFGLFSGKMKGGSHDFYILNQLCTILKIAAEPFPVPTKSLVYMVITILTTKEIETCTALIGIYQKLKELKTKSRFTKNDDDMLAYAVAGIVKRFVIMDKTNLRSTFTTVLLKMALPQKKQEQKEGVSIEGSDFTSASFIDYLMAIQSVMFPTYTFDSMISYFEKSDMPATPAPSSPDSAAPKSPALQSPDSAAPQSPALQSPDGAAPQTPAPQSPDSAAPKSPDSAAPQTPAPKSPDSAAPAANTTKTSWFSNLFKGGRKSVKRRKRRKQSNKRRSKRRKQSNNRSKRKT